LPKRAPSSDDWEGETFVQRPSTLPSSPPPPSFDPPRGTVQRGQARGLDNARPFNPEETMKLDGSELEQLDTRRTPPRRRR
jgi:hypothetical protein